MSSSSAQWKAFLSWGGWEVGGQIRAALRSHGDKNPDHDSGLGLGLLAMNDAHRVREHYGEVLLEGLVTVCHRSCVYCCDGLAMNTDG